MVKECVNILLYLNGWDFTVSIHGLAVVNSAICVSEIGRPFQYLRSTWTAQRQIDFAPMHFLVTPFRSVS